MDKIIFKITAVIIFIFLVILMLQDKANVIPIFATAALFIAGLGGIDYDDF